MSRGPPHSPASQPSESVRCSSHLADQRGKWEHLGGVSRAAHGRRGLLPACRANPRGERPTRRPPGSLTRDREGTRQCHPVLRTAGLPTPAGTGGISCCSVYLARGAEKGKVIPCSFPSAHHHQNKPPRTLRRGQGGCSENISINKRVGGAGWGRPLLCRAVVHGAARAAGGAGRHVPGPRES